MRTIRLVIDCEYMIQFENCKNFISFVKKSIETKKTKRNFKDIKVFDCLNRVITLIGQPDTKTVFNLAVMASDIMDIIYEYNQARKEHGKSLFFVDVYTITDDDGFFSEKKYLCIQNRIQWRK